MYPGIPPLYIHQYTLPGTPSYLHVRYTYSVLAAVRDEEALGSRRDIPWVRGSQDPQDLKSV